MRNRASMLIALILLAVGYAPWQATAALPSFDFTQPSGRAGWVAQHDISSLGPSADGLLVRISGEDPYFAGPARDYPPDLPLWMYVRLRSDQGGMAQVFYYQTGATEEMSVRFFVSAGEWQDVKVRLPALGSATRLRFDPPGTRGTCVFARVWFEERISVQSPAWPKPTLPDLGPDAVTLQSGSLKLIHGRSGLGAFELHVDGERMAAGHNRALLGYLLNGNVRWIPWGYGPDTLFTLTQQPFTPIADRIVGGELRAKATWTDPDGGHWQVEQTFSPGPPGSLALQVKVSVDRDRDVLYLPVFTLFPGLGSYGTNKVQGLMAGVEYLENEPSSSTADLNPPASNRQVPDTLKLTFPLMAVTANDRYVGLAWHREQANLCATFDSPDRLYQSGAQVMGLLCPGSDSLNREESSLIPYDTARLTAERSVTFTAMLLGGPGATVVPAVQQYVQLSGLPAIPNPGLSREAYYRLAAHGWLDSQIRDGDLYRHAATTGFNAGPAADAALYMDWLAPRVDDIALATRLTSAARAALALVPPAEYNARQVGHVRYPVPALAYGSVLANATSAQQHGSALLGRFQADGSVLYQKPADGLDYGRTHWARDANGLTAQVLLSLFDDALFSGSRSLMDSALRHLAALGKFRNTVPRGAQTWEIPLHTPDILAAAYLVRVYTIGYEWTGNPDYLDQARYWAWTGVPFVYLSPPTPQPVGVYSTIPVLGATAWVAPNWIGLPVQWCGLVYADALQRLAAHDPQGPWTQVATGIAVAGIQHSYPASDTAYQGLLPDSYNLRSQSRNGPAINPATVLAPAVRLFDALPLYDTAILSRYGLIVHAPGRITNLVEKVDAVSFTVEGWRNQPYYVLAVGFKQQPTIRIGGQSVPLRAPHQYQATDGRLVLQLTGVAEVELGYAASAGLKIDRLYPGVLVRLRWPAGRAAVQLQATTAISPASLWASLNLPTFQEGGYAYVNELAAEPGKFYRLKLE